MFCSYIAFYYLLRSPKALSSHTQQCTHTFTSHIDGSYTAIYGHQSNQQEQCGVPVVCPRTLWHIGKTGIEPKMFESKVDPFTFALWATSKGATARASKQSLFKYQWDIDIPNHFSLMKFFFYFVFQQDLTPAHPAKLTKSYFKNHYVNLLDWPVNGPNLNLQTDRWPEDGYQINLGFQQHSNKFHLLKWLMVFLHLPVQILFLKLYLQDQSS